MTTFTTALTRKALFTVMIAGLSICASAAQAQDEDVQAVSGKLTAHQPGGAAVLSNQAGQAAAHGSLVKSEGANDLKAANGLAKSEGANDMHGAPNMNNTHAAGH